MADVTGRNRVQGGVPTGGQFASETRGENPDLGEPDKRYSHETNASTRGYQAEDAENTEIVERYTQRKLLSRSGYRRTATVVLGRNGDGSTVTADAVLERYTREVSRDEEGNQVDGFWTVNVYTRVPDDFDRRLGRTVDPVTAMNAVSNGRTVGLDADERYELTLLVKRYHGNIRLSATAEQQRQADQIRAEVQREASGEAHPVIEDRFLARAVAEIADDHGHAWASTSDNMCRPIPPRDLERLLELLDRARTSKAMRKPGPATR